MGDWVSEPSVKAQVRALLDQLPDDCTFADVQRAIAVLMWPKQKDGRPAAAERLPADEHKGPLREWMKSRKGKP